MMIIISYDNNSTGDGELDGHAGLELGLGDLGELGAGRLGAAHLNYYYCYCYCYYYY